MSQKKFLSGQGVCKKSVKISYHLVWSQCKIWFLFSYSVQQSTKGHIRGGRARSRDGSGDEGQSVCWPARGKTSKTAVWGRVPIKWTALLSDRQFLTPNFHYMICFHGRPIYQRTCMTIRPESWLLRAIWCMLCMPELKKNIAQAVVACNIIY